MSSDPSPAPFMVGNDVFCIALQSNSRNMPSQAVVVAKARIDAIPLGAQVQHSFQSAGSFSLQAQAHLLGVGDPIEYPLDVPRYVLYHEEPRQEAVLAIARTLDVARLNSQPASWVPSTLEFYKSYPFQDNPTASEHQVPPTVPQEEATATMQSVSHEQRRSVRSEFELLEEEHDLPHPPPTARPSGDAASFIRACHTASESLLLQAIEQAESGADMLGINLATVNLDIARSKQRDFHLTSSTTPEYTTNPSLVFLDMRDIPIATAEAVVVAVQPNSVATNPMKRLRAETKKLALRQPLQEATLQAFVEELVQELERAFSKMSDNKQVYHKNQRNIAAQAQTAPSGSGRFPRTSPGSSQGPRVPAKPYAFRSDGKTPLPYGLCFFVREGKCTNPRCTFSPKDHDYESKGAQWQAPNYTQ